MGMKGDEGDCGVTGYPGQKGDFCLLSMHWS